MSGFGLVEQPWIRVTRAGRPAEVGVLEALRDASVVDGLALDDPLEAVAVLRQVLLPVVLDVFGVPRTDAEWESRWRAGGFDAGKITDYLAEHAGKFDLFDPVRPFAQAAGLRTAKGETKPVSLLVPRVASGNNVPLFTATTDGDPPVLEPKAAARALLAAHCWDTAAIKTGAADDPKVKAGKTTGNPTGPLGQLGVVVPIGETLFHTLMLNVPVMPRGHRENDRPQWMRAEPFGPRWETRAPLGLMDLLTWQSRRVRLLAEPDPSGSAGVSVCRVVVCAGDRLHGSLHDVEPHTAWRRAENPKADDPPSRPVRHQPGRAAWRGLEALLATGASTEKVTAPAVLRQLARLRDDGRVPDTLPLRVLTVGVRYGNQSAVVEDVMADEIPLPVVALARDSEVREAVLAVTGQAERLRVAANRLGDDLRAAARADKVPWDKGQRLGEVLVHRFTPTVRRLLAGLARQPDMAEAAEMAWRVAARRLAWEVVEPALSDVPPGAFLGRDPDAPFGPRLAVAEASFRRALNDVLGRADTNTTAGSTPTAA